MHVFSKSGLFTGASIAVFALGLTACGGGDGGDSTAEVTVALDNLAVGGTGRISPFRLDPASILSGPHAMAGTAADPTGFAVRLKAIYIVEDQDLDQEAIDRGDIVGNNIGEASFIWNNGECGKAGADADCADITYFDLNRTSAEVNADLNTENAFVTPGTYRYVKLALVGEQQGINNTYENTKWSYSDGGVADAEFPSVQTEWAAKFDEPLEIAEGDVVTLTVGYDLTGIVDAGTDNTEKEVGQGIYQGDKADDCVTVESTTACISFPDITVSVEKQ